MKPDLNGLVEGHACRRWVVLYVAFGLALALNKPLGVMLVEKDHCTNAKLGRDMRYSLAIGFFAPVSRHISQTQLFQVKRYNFLTFVACWVRDINFRTNKRSRGEMWLNRQIDRQTQRPTLAAHARRGLTRLGELHRWWGRVSLLSPAYVCHVVFSLRPWMYEVAAVAVGLHSPYLSLLAFPFLSSLNVGSHFQLRSPTTQLMAIIPY